MKAAALSEIKRELTSLPPKEILEICLRMARYKKENKELLTYLLFEAYDESDYIKNVKKEMSDLFSEINKSNIYFAKKSIRKILRTANKHIRYSGLKRTEAELLIYFCQGMKKSGIDIQKSVSLSNLYERQLQKIKKALATLHEDLQYDYEEDVRKLKLVYL